MSDSALTLLWRKRRSRAGRPSSPRKPVSFFEFWPGWLFYAPVVAHWLWQSVKYRSLTLPALANPRINAGGICGESKNQILDLAGPAARPWIARHAGLVTSGHQDGNDLAKAEAAMAGAGLTFPLVVKPDMSCNGVGVRVAADAAGLASYLAAFPRATALQLQELVPHDGEAGIFYIRHPEEATGRITSVTLKFAPTVIGDGTSTLRGLIAADHRLNAIAHVLLPKLGAKAAQVPPPGQAVRLVFVGNHCRGSTFRDGMDIVTPALTQRIEAIVKDVPELYFSRLDLRYGSLEELRAGENFKIIEINGSGSEATHIWDPAMTIRAAYAAQFYHYRESFRIGAKIRATGQRPLGLLRLFALYRHQKRLMAGYPAND